MIGAIGVGGFGVFKQLENSSATASMDNGYFMFQPPFNASCKSGVGRFLSGRQPKPPGRLHPTDSLKAGCDSRIGGMYSARDSGVGSGMVRLLC